MKWCLACQVRQLVRLLSGNHVTDTNSEELGRKRSTLAYSHYDFAQSFLE
jgi:hypothetical protein